MKLAAGLPDDSIVPALARAFDAAGGRLLVVGGWVRDGLRGAPSKDLDLEVFGLSTERVGEILEGFGSVGEVGRHFPVWRLRHQNLDIAHPREGNLLYRGDRPDSLEEAFRIAARHRDLTLNAIAWDPLANRCLDPWHGIEDLEARRLRAVDAETFVTDPVRGLRVARLAATLEADVDAGTLELCAGLDPSEAPVERLARELGRMILEPRRPSRALELLDETRLIERFAPLAALRGVEQDPRWHPEGDVFLHTCMVLDAARTIGEILPMETRSILQWSALCHDLGKPETTTHEDGRIRSIRHESVGAELAKHWLGSLRLPQGLVKAVAVLVAGHLAPVQFVSQSAGPRAYRRLARRLAEGSMTMVDLERLARADQLGRTTAAARAGRFDAGGTFLETARGLGLEAGPISDVVSAKDLMERGYVPGPTLGRALERCRAIQDDRGWQEPDPIIELVLREISPEAAT